MEIPTSLKELLDHGINFGLTMPERVLVSEELDSLDTKVAWYFNKTVAFVKDEELMKPELVRGISNYLGRAHWEPTPRRLPDYNSPSRSLATAPRPKKPFKSADKSQDSLAASDREMENLKAMFSPEQRAAIADSYFSETVIQSESNIDLQTAWNESPSLRAEFLDRFELFAAYKSKGLQGQTPRARGNQAGRVASPSPSTSEDFEALGAQYEREGRAKFFGGNRTAERFTAGDFK
jgi:hypothetical protein